ncbi:putative Zn-dependent peptidase [Bacilli bacterium PM5-3]|nr:putative Zn-dependent peptidase [Bacilli bacterium PM5-3]MDH6603033.1 putative Zn-dependent peptidase [Bacilli bacterium PM5-9]
MQTNYNIKKSDKFKTNYLQIRYLIDAKKENTSLASLLSMYITYSNNIQKTYKEATDYLDSLYGCKLDISISLKGDKIAFDITIIFVASRFLNSENYLENIINTYLTYIFNPLQINNSFDNTVIDLKKYELKERIKSIYDDKTSYATEQFFKVFAKNYPLSLNMAGYIEDIELITNDTLYNFYNELIKQTPYVCGILTSSDYNKTITILNEKIPEVSYNNFTNSYQIEIDDIKEVIESQDIVQSKLLVGLTIDDEINNENYYYYFLINILFGLSSNSYLFKIVREKENLCYTIRSSYVQYCNSIAVLAGIEKENYSKTVSLIEEILEMMKNGEITSDDFKDAKSVAKDMLQKVKDSQVGLVSYDINRTMQQYSTDLDYDIKMIENIELEQLVEKVKNIKLKAKYLLSGDKNE